MGDTLEAALQALITALFVALAVLGLAMVLHYDNPALAALIAGSVIGLLAWLAFRDRVSRLGDYQRGYTPPAQPVTQSESSTVIRVVAVDGQAGNILKFGIQPEKLQTLANGLANGEPFSQVRWQGLLTRSELAAVVSEFVRFGYARERSPGTPARGYELTPQGKAVVRYLGRPE